MSEFKTKEKIHDREKILREIDRCLEQNKGEEADNLSLKLMEDFGVNDETVQCRSKVLRYLKKFEELLGFLRCYTMVNPESLKGFSLLTGILISMGATQEACRLCDAFLLKNPNQNLAVIKKIRCFLIDNEFDEIPALIEQARSLGCPAVLIASTEKAYLNRLKINAARQEMDDILEYGDLNHRFIQLDRLYPWLCKKINTETAFLYGRIGRGEGLIATQYLKSEEYTADHERMGGLNAGIIPPNYETFDKFSRVYLESAKDADVLGLLRVEEQVNLARRIPHTPVTKHWWLCPFDLMRETDNHSIPRDTAWTKALESKRVLVISPFSEEIKYQYARKSKIRSIADILPEFDLLTYVPAQTAAGANPDKNWISELERMQEEISNIRFDIAIIGAGAYGLPLGAGIKRLGRSALVLGGITQILFGVIGNRWEWNYKQDGIADATWIRPYPQSRPPKASSVEDACYW